MFSIKNSRTDLIEKVDYPIFYSNTNINYCNLLNLNKLFDGNHMKSKTLARTNISMVLYHYIIQHFQTINCLIL